ncbi:pentapeptide repeat-containing protein [Flavobacterium cupreum]|uniref:Pentapeptide repeat-containing protein n=1 Tax=Flavobacterium cupreum TaxID=2133766 RepID=A0A434ABF8_9FLAO|nr:pentapeptide repeat-containing protein [Flavobacterium cupreum]RUT71733.1 pentapeptide repeat-containing protein [Flavobacterium cupreum]
MKKYSTITIVGYSFLILGILLLLLHKYPANWYFSGFIKEIYANLSCELMSIAITILLINYLYEKREESNNKRRLIRELGSEDKGFTSRALKEIKELGYLVDGTLNGADLSSANLEGLDFTGANLQNVNFSKARLTNSIFKGVQFEGVRLDGAEARQCNFERSVFNNVSLKGSNLYSAIFIGCQISNADFLKAKIEQTEFIDSKIENSKFEDSVIRLANFLRAQISNSNFAMADLNGITIRQAKFERCDMNNVTGWENMIDSSLAEFHACLNVPTQP